MSMQLNGPLNLQGDANFLNLSKDGRVKLAFIINGVVERIMIVKSPLPEIVAGEYTFTNTTEQGRIEKNNNNFYFELEANSGEILKISSDESMLALMSSLPLGVEIPSDIDVQVGWTYTAENGFVSN
jgi:hypothetical protein